MKIFNIGDHHYDRQLSTLTDRQMWSPAKKMLKCTSYNEQGQSVSEDSTNPTGFGLAKMLHLRGNLDFSGSVPVQDR